jgi:hypothetical protein
MLHIQYAAHDPLIARKDLLNVAERFDTTVVSGLRDEALHRNYGKSVRILAFPINGDIAPLRDVLVLWKFGRTIIHGRLDLVHTIALKVGLLGKLAALLECEIVAA